MGIFYAKDSSMGTALLGGEIVGFNRLYGGCDDECEPSKFHEFLGWFKTLKTKGRSLELYGGVFFGLTWLADILHAPTAVREYNEEHGLQPILSPEFRWKSATHVGIPFLTFLRIA
jgi:hypothetical protein